MKNPYDLNYLAKDGPATLAEYDLADITEDGHAAVIIDTISSDTGGTSLSTAARNLGMDDDDLIAELREGGVEIADDADPDEAFDDWEFATEAVEERAEKLADEINADPAIAALPGKFYFSWHEGGFYLFYGGDAADFETEGEDE